MDLTTIITTVVGCLLSADIIRYIFSWKKNKKEEKVEAKKAELQFYIDEADYLKGEIKERDDKSEKMEEKYETMLAESRKREDEKTERLRVVQDNLLNVTTEFSDYKANSEKEKAELQLELYKTKCIAMDCNNRVPMNNFAIEAIKNKQKGNGNKSGKDSE